MIILVGLLLFGESRAVDASGEPAIKLDTESELRLILLNEVLTNSKHKGKSTYNTWVTYFTEGPGTASEVRLEAMLVLWLSLYILPSGPEDEINSFVFSLAIRLGKGEKIALAPIFLGLFYRLDEHVHSLVRSMGSYTVASYKQTAFLQLFHCERFKSYDPQPSTFEVINMMTVENENGIIRSVPDRPEKNRAQRWSNLKQLRGKDLVEYIDSEKHFSFRIYRSTGGGCEVVCGFWEQPRGISADLLTWLAIITPTLLPLIIESKAGTANYNPQRVMRQLGYNQSVVQLSEEMGCSDSVTVESQFIGDGKAHMVSKFQKIFWPDRVRIGVRSPDGAIYWRMLMEKF